MLGDQDWLTVSDPVHPEGVACVEGQGSVKASHALPLQPEKTSWKNIV